MAARHYLLIEGGSLSVTVCWLSLTILLKKGEKRNIKKISFQIEPFPSTGHYRQNMFLLTKHVDVPTSAIIHNDE